MSIRGLVLTVIGVIAFVIIDQIIIEVITGTDAGSNLITSTLRIIVAGAILIGVMRFMGSGGK